MLKLNRKSYMDKLRACWIGKNIGGTIGAPYEGKRELLDVREFAGNGGEPLPNDDLDLQLVWLCAMEDVGADRLNANILSEYWLDWIPPHWNEYGTAKNNMRAGFPVGIANRYKNIHKDSCGCFIRSEIWACLAPGRPDIAVKYAYEDGVLTITYPDGFASGKKFTIKLQGVRNNGGVMMEDVEKSFITD